MSEFNQSQTVDDAIRQRRAFLTTVILLIVSIGLIVLYLILGWQLRSWQIFVLAGMFVGYSAATLVSMRLIRTGRINTGAWIYIISLYPLGPIAVLVVTDISLIVGLVLATMAFIAAYLVLPKQQVRIATAIGIGLVILDILIDQLPLDYRFTLPILKTVIPIAGGTVVLVVVIFVFYQAWQSNLRPKLIMSFLLVATIPLLVVAGVVSYRTYTGQSNQALETQAQVAKRVAEQVKTFILTRENELRTLTDIRGMATLSLQEQKELLTSLLGAQKDYDELVLVDGNGQEQVYISRLKLVSEDDLTSRVGTDEFEQPSETGETYFSPVQFDPITGEPSMVITIPIFDLRTGEMTNALIANLRLKTVWDLMAQADVVGDGIVYMVDDTNKVVAHADPSVVLGGTRVDLPSENAFTPGIDGSDVAMALENISLSGQDFTIVAELSQAEATELAASNLTITIVIVAVAMVAAGLFGALMARLIATPVSELADAAESVSAGDYSRQVEIETKDEIGVLAKAFNAMTIQLRDFINTLEQRVADRTHRLEIVATLGEQLNAILDPNDLLREVVNQVKANFGYYHTHIYLLDEVGETLVVAAGTGSAGEEMIAAGHSISLNAAASLVARTARSGEIVTVDNVREAEDWLPNPLLPDTRAEMAVPIVEKGTVIGVLDVQDNEIGGLDESDANLLRSLANQVAVALSNARLFKETTRAKEEAELAQKDIEIANKALEAQVWQTSGQAELNDKMQGEQDVSTLANSIVQQLCHYLKAQIGALYVVDNDYLNLAGSYAYSSKKPSKRFKFGEGLVGQAVLEKQPVLITNVPDGHLLVRSGFSKTPPKNVMVFPFMYEGRALGVIELGTLTEFNPAQKEFLQTALNNIAIVFNTAQVRARINELLAETQQQAEELQVQSEELRVANEELETQTRSLQASETQLREKQAVLDQQNRELMIAQEELERKARELALASKYKSEFLANMSHELRTPLNSLLILARMLVDNKEGNLTREQVESAQIIYSGGTDLLNLINDILDLSKVEAGQMIFNFETMPLTDLVSTMRMQFEHVAKEKELEFIINLADDLPGRINTDLQRVKQVVKNLLSNAFKFTSQGSVSLNLYRPDTRVDLSRSGLDPSRAIALSVADSGIGMTPEQLQVIFEAFQQADGSTSRQYGGTGLGLSISRELAANLGGQVDVTSQPGKGSTFTLYLPIDKQAGDKEKRTEVQEQKVEKPQVKQPQRISPQPAPSPASRPAPPDDRAELAGPAERDDEVKIITIIEDDPNFAKVIYNYAHEKGFKCLIAGEGNAGLELVRAYQPEAIILDLNLPDMSGWDVLNVLKHDPDTRHIPIHIISADDATLDAYRKGAMGYLTKPVDQEHLAETFQNIEHFIDREIKTLLLVEDDAALRRSITKLLNGSDVQISEADQGQTALNLLKNQHFDCMILDLSLPDMSGFAVLNKINDDETIAKCPVIVYTGRELTPEENVELMQYADRVIVKGVKSPERLLDETALFLHQVVAEMPADKQQTIKQLYNKDGLLEGKKVLIVDDDMRNSFALSKLLSDKGIITRIAPNGQKALDLLAEDSDVDLILMDIMMPVLDGYETTKCIRGRQEFKTLPILALTAKAMKGDREKCLEAGASDYLPKPVDIDRLFSMLRVWLFR